MTPKEEKALRHKAAIGEAQQEMFKKLEEIIGDLVPWEEHNYVLPLDMRVRRLVAIAKRAKEADRWACRMRDLENRARHAVDVLSGKFTAPQIAEVRAVRGLEELPQLGKEYQP